MTSPAARVEIIAMVAEVVGGGARESRACAIVGMSLRTLQRWKLTDTRPDGRTTRVQEPRHALTIEERKHILAVVNSAEFGQLPPSQNHAGLDDKLPVARKAVYEAARAANPLRWTGATRNWSPVKEVHLNPDVTINEIAAPASNAPLFKRTA
jgi:putative transposase